MKWRLDRIKISAKISKHLRVNFAFDLLILKTFDEIPTTIIWHIFYNQRDVILQQLKAFNSLKFEDFQKITQNCAYMRLDVVGKSIVQNKKQLILFFIPYSRQKTII